MPQIHTLGRLRSIGLFAVAVSSPAFAQSMPELFAKWQQVDNSSGNLDSAQKYLTFDLFVHSSSPIVALDSGFAQSSGPNSGLSIENTSFFQQEFFGTDNDLPPTPGMIGAEPRLEFDSYMALGVRTASEILAPAPIVFSETGVVGVVSIQGGAEPVEPDGGRVFAGRFTISTITPDWRLGGEMLVFVDGADSGVVVNVPFVPAPASMTLLLLPSLIHRRR